jgi:hypothetical protein
LFRIDGTVSVAVEELDTGVGVVVEVIVGVGVGVGVNVGVAVGSGVDGGFFVAGCVVGSALEEGVSAAAAMCVSVRTTGRGVGVACWQPVTASVLLRAVSRIKMSMARGIGRTVNLPSGLGPWPYVTTFRPI